MTASDDGKISEDRRGALRYAFAIGSGAMAVRREPDKRWRDFLSVWVDYNRGIGQMREWFLKGLALSGVKPEDVPVELNI